MNAYGIRSGGTTDLHRCTQIDHDGDSEKYGAVVLTLLIAGMVLFCGGSPALASADIGTATRSPIAIDDNAALRYVTGAAHLATAPVGFGAAVISWGEGPATGTLASWAIEFAGRQERPRTFLLLGDHRSTCSFTPDNQGVEQYEMPPCSALETLGQTQVAAALHQPALSAASAAELLAATFIMGDRLAHHGVLVSRMTGTRIRRLALHGMRHLLERSTPSQDAARLINNRLSAIPSPRQEVQEQIHLDTTYLLTLLAAGKTRPELLIKFGFERHPAVLAMPSAIKLFEKGCSPLELTTTLVSDPIWETWVAGLKEYFARAAAVDPLSPNAGSDLGVLVSGPAALENPLIGSLCWDFSWVHQKLSDFEHELAEIRALAQRIADKN